MTKGKSGQEASDRSDDLLSPEEATAAMNALPPAQKIKLCQVARVMRSGTGLGSDELLSEAMSRTMLGARNCPRHVPMVAFLIKVMQSIASHDREARKRMVSLHAVSKQGEAVAATAIVEDVDMAMYAAAELERQGEETIAAISALFQGDEEAQYLVIAWSSGLRGAELRDFMQLDQAGIDRVAKRVKKKAKKYYPDGWKR